MAADFIGRVLNVTLKPPSNTVLQGVVANVDPQTHTLFLQNVFLPATGQRFGSFKVEGSSIADIKLLDSPAPPPPIREPELIAVKQVVDDLPTPTQSKPPPKPFHDPAILSFGDAPSAPLRGDYIPTPNQAPAATLLAAPVPLAQQGKSVTSAVAAAKPNPPPTAATLTAPFSSLKLGQNANEEDTDDPTVVDDGIRRVSITKTRSGKPMDEPIDQLNGQKSKKKKAKARRKEGVADEVQSQSAAALESSPEAVRKPGNPLRGKGWRQTPILQDQPSFPTAGADSREGTPAVPPSKRKARKQKAMQQVQNGWATEDATDIQDMPEFDFEGNLSKFDKRSVFDQIRNEDTTADEDRLVSINRLPRPGTFGGQKLHPSENVLGPAQRPSDLSSSSGDDFQMDSGRNSRRAMSRASTKRRPYGSTVSIADDTQNILNASASSILKQSQSVSNISENETAQNLDSDDSQHSRSFNKSAYASSHTASPRIGARFTPPESPGAPGPAAVQPQPIPQGAHFRFTTSHRTCPTITPGGMHAIEEYAEMNLGLTETVMGESAGRGIAEVCLHALNPGGRRLAPENVRLNQKPVAVVLVGNHKTGARAVAAARHLLGRSVRVIVCVLGLERGKDGLENGLRVQLNLFSKVGGAIGGWKDVQQALKRLNDAPIELVLDALLASGSRGLEGLGNDDSGNAVEIVKWANSLRSSVGVGVDGISGVHGGTGEMAVVSGQPFFIRSKHVASLGAPRTGLLRASQPGGVNESRTLKIWVVDIGVNKAWKVYGPPGAGRGVRFGADWVAQVEYDDGTEG